MSVSLWWTLQGLTLSLSYHNCYRWLRCTATSIKQILFTVRFCHPRIRCAVICGVQAVASECLIIVPTAYSSKVFYVAENASPTHTIKFLSSLSQWVFRRWLKILQFIGNSQCIRRSINHESRQKRSLSTEKVALSLLSSWFSPESCNQIYLTHHLTIHC